LMQRRCINLANHPHAFFHRKTASLDLWTSPPPRPTKNRGDASNRSRRKRATELTTDAVIQMRPSSAICPDHRDERKLRSSTSRGEQRPPTPRPHPTVPAEQEGRLEGRAPPAPPNLPGSTRSGAQTPFIAQVQRPPSTTATDLRHVSTANKRRKRKPRVEHPTTRDARDKSTRPILHLQLHNPAPPPRHRRPTEPPEMVRVWPGASDSPPKEGREGEGNGRGREMCVACAPKCFPS
jgi:hypothetical protein